MATPKFLLSVCGAMRRMACGMEIAVSGCARCDRVDHHVAPHLRLVRALGTLGHLRKNRILRVDIGHDGEARDDQRQCEVD